MELHFTATGCHLAYGITQCYLPPDTSEVASEVVNTPSLNPRQPDLPTADWPRRDGRLSWPEHHECKYLAQG